ncbi:hypothetical protein UA38_12795 [Photobacterium kishitanii]|uniref:Metallophosphoesterase n=1 Tax=Photobacterium kishitanii TaxID=318456 RepID=A0AAX0YTF6_9GAMM|nr:metallophosphoesterase family protein [Photobacterium kishitanii]KJG56850.1 hypothetical protein UA38_12795 [Photobacterium kishitanii]KJG60411.1 hypothetical protein UA42_15575 [Photobacterium kishitanii]KJG64693.1 hypothetical protein UA40_15290 [Photobacterium kishitanii]KJG68905.1 hypothetical protein UA41_14420 [Photobacterium kishitanii]PSX18837.1 metallophosphoesterase [Photobacterium kishitanii]
MRIAVISDIHANVFALKKALNIITKSSVDKVIFLGDLLTYGCDVNQTIEALQMFSYKKQTVFIKGNHDQIYFDMQNKKEFQYKPFPDFILESVWHTYNEMDCKLIDVFDWKDSTIIENIYFSHANALGYGNWCYLNTDDEIYQTSKIILNDDLSGGVFGHTHRNKYSDVSLYELNHMEKNINNSYIQTGKCFITNPGSIGQPRGNTPSFLLMDIMSEKVRTELVYFEYEDVKHIESINKSTLSIKTKNKLISYFK